MSFKGSACDRLEGQRPALLPFAARRLYDTPMSADLPVPALARSAARPPPHRRDLPLRVGTRGSPLALWQTRHFLERLRGFCPVLRGMDVFQEHAIRTTGDAVQDRRLAEIGGKGLFAKEIHEALLDRRVDFAVHSLKDLETELPPGIVLACTLKREDARDAIILAPGVPALDPADPLASLPDGAVIGTSSMRRQAQLLHVRPDLNIKLMRGNVQSRLAKLAAGECTATLLAVAGLKRLGLAHHASVVLGPEVMVPSACQSASPCARTTASCTSCSPASRIRRRAPSPPPSGRCWRRSTVPAARRSAAMPTCRRRAACT